MQAAAQSGKKLSWTLKENALGTLVQLVWKHRHQEFASPEVVCILLQLATLFLPARLLLLAILLTLVTFFLLVRNKPQETLMTPPLSRRGIVLSLFGYTILTNLTAEVLQAGARSVANWRSLTVRRSLTSGRCLICTRSLTRQRSSLTGRRSLVGRRNLISRRLPCWTLVLLVCQVVQTYRLLYLRYKLRILHLNQLL